MTKMEVVVDLYNWNTHCNVVLIASNQAGKQAWCSRAQRWRSKTRALESVLFVSYNVGRGREEMQVHTRRHELDAVVGDVHIVASRNRTEPVEARS